MVYRHLAQHGLDGVEVPDDPVLKPDLFHRIRSDAAVLQVISDGQNVRCPVNSQDQIVARAAGDDISWSDRGVELHNVELACRRIVAVDGILTRPSAKVVGIVPQATGQNVIGAVPNQLIV